MLHGRHAVVANQHHEHRTDNNPSSQQRGATHRQQQGGENDRKDQKVVGQHVTRMQQQRCVASQGDDQAGNHGARGVAAVAGQVVCRRQHNQRADNDSEGCRNFWHQQQLRAHQQATERENHEDDASQQTRLAALGGVLHHQRRFGQALPPLAQVRHSSSPAHAVAHTANAPRKECWDRLAHTRTELHAWPADHRFPAIEGSFC